MIPRKAFDRYIRPNIAERYIKRFRGEIKRLCGYTLLLSINNTIVAFIVDATPELEYKQQHLF